MFDLFFRKTSENSSYAVMAGLEQLIDYVQNLHFDANDIALPALPGTVQRALPGLSGPLPLHGDLYAIEEGTVVFPYEPLVRVTAPIMEAQLLETAMLNIINHQTLIASKAARVCMAAEGDLVMEFGLRRAQGPDARHLWGEGGHHRRLRRHLQRAHRPDVLACPWPAPTPIPG